MISSQLLNQALQQPLDGVDLPFLGVRTRGKVRDIYRHDDKLVLITTDRLSAFDHILGLVPYKGQVLNQLSAFWFEQTADIIGNHLLDTPDPNVMVAKACQPLPVEVVVRGYISGVTKTALWYQYSEGRVARGEDGRRIIYGIPFPDGLQKNDRLPEPIITPTTKASDGGHDERITNTQVTEMGLVSEEQWAQISDAAIRVFKRGQEVAAAAGLILVDTKYEFGLTDAGEIVLIDEVHTPDSSRFWIADSYDERRAAGQEPENFDKEFVRLYYAAKGYRGDGAPFPLPDDLALQAASRYIRTYELLTGREFEPGGLPAAARIERNLRNWLG